MDLKFLRENLEIVKTGLAKKHAVIDVDEILKIDEKRRELLQKVEGLRAEQNKAGEEIAKLKGAEKEAAMGKMKEVKDKLKSLEKELAENEAVLEEKTRAIPNLPQEDVPEGVDERDNVVLREVGEKPNFAFKPKDYVEIGEKLDLIDTERAAKVSGSRFGYLKGAAALLELALVRLAFEEAMKEGFIPVIPPVMIKSESMKAMGYVDTERDREERYYFEKDDLYLVGTSEQSIGPMHKDEVFGEKELPKRYIGFSTCFRREAGSYGKDTKGILRVHQFDKAELFSFCSPEKSRDEHQLLLKIEETLMKKLGLHYRVVHLCAGDIAKPSASTYDIECWLPGQNGGKGEYRETHSTSNTTDFQSRRLNIKYRRESDNKLDFVHALNGTAFAIGRMIIAILENYQQEDGSIKIPEVLRPYIGLEEIKGLA